MADFKVLSRDRRKHRKSGIRIFGNVADIQTAYVQNTDLELTLKEPADFLMSDALQTGPIC